jgi:chromosome partitioning protein
VKVIAVGSPKGGVGKTTAAVTLATIVARQGQRVLLVDCDANRSALDWCAGADEAIPLDVSDGRDLAALRRLRESTGYDLAVVDLPGARAGAFQTLLTGETRDRRPVVDLLVVPTSPELMEGQPR